jgi:hypothetical protein
MNKSYNGKWDGVAALIWVAMIVLFFGAYPTSVSYWIWSHLPEMPERIGFVFWGFVWWPPVLVLSISGLWRGNTASRICAVLAILFAAGVVVILCMAGV